MRALFAASAVLAISAAASSQPVNDPATMFPHEDHLEGYSFQQYLRATGKQYSRQSHAARKAVFEANLQEAIAHNADKTNTWKMGINFMSDMTVEEVSSMNGYRHAPDFKADEEVGHGYTAADVAALSEEGIDYRNTGHITAVKDQGHCGSCWAHSAVETMESQTRMQLGHLPRLSAQQFTSCVPLTFYSAHCMGGHPSMAWKWVMKLTADYNAGLVVEHVYPYVSYFGNNGTCYDPRSLVPNPVNATWTRGIEQITATKVKQVTPNNEHAMAMMLKYQGPMSVIVAAATWGKYKKGIFQQPTFGGVPTKKQQAEGWAMDHAVQIVGYGFDQELNMAYWIVRNTWGVIWGENGFIRLRRYPNGNSPCNKNVNHGWKVCGTSGVLAMATFPEVKQIVFDENQQLYPVPEDEAPFHA